MKAPGTTVNNWFKFNNSTNQARIGQFYITGESDSRAQNERAQTFFDRFARNTFTKQVYIILTLISIIIIKATTRLRTFTFFTTRLRTYILVTCDKNHYVYHSYIRII